MKLILIWHYFTDQNSNAFKEVAIIRHPRIGEYAFGFITSSVVLQRSVGDEELCCVYVPTNHLYLGDIFLINSNDIMRPNLSVREGIGMILNIKSRTVSSRYESLTKTVLVVLRGAEIVISGGMSVPQILTTVDAHQTIPAPRMGNFPAVKV